MSEDYTKTVQDSISLHRHIQYYGKGADSNAIYWQRANWSSSVTGVKLPSWRQRIRNGQSATTRLVGSKYAFQSYTPGSFSLVYKEWVSPKWWTEQYYKTGTWNYPSDFTAFPSPASVGESIADNSAKGKLIKRARQAQTTFSLGVSGGELGETLRFIRSPLRGLHQSLRDYMLLVKKRARERRYVKRRNLDKKVRETLLNRMVAGTWLEAQLAISPLMGEVKSAAEAAARIVMKQELKRVPVNARGEYTVYSKTLNPSAGWSDFFRNLSEDKHSIQVIYRGAVRIVSPEKHRLRSAAQIAGVMPQDFAPTMWELIPGSFLMDYVYNVDDIISAASYARSNFAWLQKTVRKEAVRTVTTLHDFQGKKNSLGLNTPGEVIITHTFSTPRSVLLRTSVERDVYEGSLVPDLTVNVPTSVKQWANIGGLLLVQKRVIEFLR